MIKPMKHTVISCGNRHLLTIIPQLFFVIIIINLYKWINIIKNIQHWFVKKIKKLATYI